MNAGRVPGGPYDVVVDVGAHVGAFAESAAAAWGSRIVAFEPLAPAADFLRARSMGRWEVVEAALSDERGEATLHVCVGHPSASSLLEAGSALRELGVSEERADATVGLALLDDWFGSVCDAERLLVKVDAEGHELRVLRGGGRVLTLASAVVVEVQNAPDVYVGAPSARELDEELRAAGLSFAGVLDGAVGEDGRVLQFDGMWTRP